MTTPQNTPIAGVIDHTLLKPGAGLKAITQLCHEAVEHGFASVCVLPRFVSPCRPLLAGSRVHVGTVVGFPLGGHLPEIKVMETRRAVEAGAQEIDMVISIGDLIDGEDQRILDEIRGVGQAAGPEALVKVILETCLLNREQKIRGARLAQKAGAHFVKTSTGFAASGATVEDVALLRHTVGKAMGVKASGGVRTLQQSLALMQAGADRIGTSSGVAIVEETTRLGSE